MGKASVETVPAPACSHRVGPTAGALTRERFLSLRTGWHIFDKHSGVWTVIAACPAQSMLVLLTPAHTEKTVFWQDGDAIRDREKRFVVELNHEETEAGFIPHYR